MTITETIKCHFNDKKIRNAERNYGNKLTEKNIILSLPFAEPAHGKCSQPA